MKQKSLLALAAVGIAAALVGCSDGGKGNMTLNGAGASFPAPVYQDWTYSYSQTGNVKVNYQSVGSGAGVNQIKAGTVHFAGTDNPLTLEELEKDGLEQFPMLMGGVVVIINVPGVENGMMKLGRDTLPDIFLGKITRWNDPKIQTLNPDLQLPDLPITVVRRADASGTSFIFTHYLEKISEEWKTKVGSGSSVNWPVGIGGQKNPGVCNNVAKISGSIGYTEYTYAIEANLAMVALENTQGQFVQPTMETFATSAANADWKNAPGFYMVLTNQPGENSWPITGVTYVLIRKDCDPEIRAELIKYFNWCFTSGISAAKKLHYVPIPENTVELIREKVLK